MSSMMSSRAAQLGLLAAGAAIGITCTGTKSGPGPADPSDPVASADARQPAPADDPPAPAPADQTGLRPPNNPPSLEIPAYEIVGVGQEIGFGLEVIDEESDVFSVELLEKPASATYDPYTLTVVWKPTRKDMPAGAFRVRITEKRRDTGATRVQTQAFSIAVSAKRQPELHAQPLDPAVETLITIHDPDRLALANKAWPLDKMLAHAANLEHALLPDDVQQATSKPDAAQLYERFLRQLARAHDNPTVDPESDQFDKKSFGNARDWKIIAVRPRLDKKWHEIRIIYRATRAHAATYTMFRWRPTIDAAPPEAREFNNKEMSRLVLEAFFRDDGTLDPKYARDEKAHARRVAWLLDQVLNYQNDAHPWASTGFLALPTEARLGGGSVRGADGNYASGDGWGWNVIKLKPHDGAMEPVNVPIKGFVTDLAPSADGASWEMKCGARFDPHDEAHEPGYEVLCRETAHVDLPGSGDGYADTAPGGKVVPSFIDAANLFVEHKEVHTVATVPLRDPRRDLFEENGMTCSQCHVRSFGVRDMYDRTAYDPSAGTPTTANKKQDTTYFVIVPTVSWQPYAIDFQRKQECKFKAAIETDLGKTTSLTCPLKAE